jgi:ribosomal protein L11 methyltransferase
VPSASPGWIALRVTAPPELVDTVANFLLEEGAAGVVSEDAGLESALPASRLDALDRWLASLAELDPRARGIHVATAPVADLDWMALARQHHRPITVGRRLLVAPPWDVPTAPGRELLVIEPGMAFGTGQHATTRGCLEAIEAAVADGGVRSALDVGTGSGILALALERLGVPRVVALDTDPAVLPVARANLARNGARRFALVAGSLAALRARFDLVVANLVAASIVAESSALAAAVAAGGRLVLSGLLDDQAGPVARAYPGWRVVETRGEAGWQTLTLERDR